MNKRAVITIVVLLAAFSASAQWYWPMYPMLADTCDTSRVAGHLSVGTSVAAGFGNTESVSWVAPSVKWRATDRLTIRGGFAVAGSLLPMGYELHGRGPQNLTPLKHGTRLGGVWAQAEYRANEHLTLWGSMARMTGFVQPLWDSGSLPVDITSVSGGFAYRFNQNSLLTMHFHFVHDGYGYMLHPPYGHSYYGPLSPEFELFSGPWPF